MALLARLQHLPAVALLVLISVALCVGSHAQASDDPPSPVPDSLRWAGGVFRWHYNRALEPDWLAPGAGLYLFRAAADIWQGCGPRLEFAGETDQMAGRMDGLNVAGWSVSLPAGHRGLTLRRRMGEALAEADVLVSAASRDLRASHELLRKVIAHEFGHALGLIHSADCADLMSFGAACSAVAPARLPTQPAAGDLLQCTKRYGAPPPSGMTGR